MKPRIATQADARSIAEVQIETWQVAYRGQVPDEYLESLSIDRRETIWSQILAGSNLPSTGAFVIEDDARN